MRTEKRFSLAEAKQIGDALGIDWLAFDVEPLAHIEGSFTRPFRAELFGRASKNL